MRLIIDKNAYIDTKEWEVIELKDMSDVVKGVWSHEVTLMTLQEIGYGHSEVRKLVIMEKLSDVEKWFYTKDRDDKDKDDDKDIDGDDD